MQSKRWDAQPFIVVFVTLICLHVILMAVSRLYPFIDLPNHLAAATINRYYGDSSNMFSTYYSLDLFPKPNVFHLLFCSLPVFGSVELANRIFLCLSVILLPVSVLLLIRKLGGNRWLSLLSFLLLYNYNVTWGFLGFSFAIPFILFFLYLCIDFIERGRWKTGGAAAGLLVLLFFVHALAALFCLLIFIVYCLLSGKTPIRIMERCAAIAPAAVLLIFWWNAEGAAYRGQGIADYLEEYYDQAYLAAFADRLTIFYQDNSSLFLGTRGVAAGLFFTLCIIVPVLAAAILRRKDRHRKRIKGIRPAMILFAVSLACIIVLPRDLPHQAILYQRFSPILLLSSILLGGCLLREKIRRPVIIGICIVCAIHLALWTDYLHDFNERNRTFTPEFFPPAGGGRTLAGLISKFTYRGVPVYIHFPAYYIIWRQGIATTSLVDYRFGSVRRAVGFDVLPKYLEWAGRMKIYDGRYRAMDYILIRGEFPTQKVEHFADFTLMRSADRWFLFERNR